MKYYISGDAEISGDGSKQKPFKTIQEAADIVSAGDQVIISPGIYRECVNPLRGGTEKNRIVYCAEKPGKTVITGAEKTMGWKQLRNSLWQLSIKNDYFGSYNPYKEKLWGDWLFNSWQYHTGAVYLNDKILYEKCSLEEVENPLPDRSSWDPQGSLLCWYTEQEGDRTILYANFGSADPNQENVEICVRQNCFYPVSTGINYITLSGLIISKAATKWSSPTSYQDGMVGTHWSKGWIIEDCEISHSRCVGISIGKYYQSGNDNAWTLLKIKHGTQREREVIFRALREGWSKEKVGSHIIRRCHIHDCGQTGISGHMGGAFSIIEDNHIHHIGSMQELVGAELGGIKLHAAIDVQIRRNHIDHCVRGIWLDWQAQGTRVSQNLFHDNVPPEGTDIKDIAMVGEDIFVEVSHGPTLIDNNIMLSDFSCRLSAQGIALVHNLIAGSLTYVGIGADNGSKKYPSPRFTPYHVPHSTQIAGIMMILHGDVRFYNNIFVQTQVRSVLRKYAAAMHENKINRMNCQCGTAPYDGYPEPSDYFDQFESDDVSKLKDDLYYGHLPVYTGGNLYLNGARPKRGDTDCFYMDQCNVICVLKQDEQGLVLNTDIFRKIEEQYEKIRTFEVSTETLGVAFEPEQRFENPDGSPIFFDLDFFGKKREKNIPGPFSKIADIYRLTDCEENILRKKI